MKAELFILGVLHRGNFHPYEIKRRLSSAMLECFTDVDVGTLYYAIRQLARRRLIEAVARERVARGGMRTVYAITAKGRERFQELLHGQFAAVGPVAQTLYGAVLFLHLAQPDQVADLLSRKITAQSDAIAELAAIRRRMAPVLSTGAVHLIRHLDQQRRSDRRWLRALLADVEGGRIRDVADPSRLATKT